MSVRWLVLALLVAGCGGAPSPRAEVPPDEPEESAPEEQDPETVAVALRLEDAGTDEHDTPHTRVMLVRIGQDGDRSVVELGREMGACYHESPARGTLIAARCWWAGAGARYAVQREHDDVVAYRAEEDEDEGPPAEPEEVGRLELPENAVVQVLGADGTSHLY